MESPDVEVHRTLHEVSIQKQAHEVVASQGVKFKEACTVCVERTLTEEQDEDREEAQRRLIREHIAGTSYGDGINESLRDSVAGRIEH